MYGQFFVLCHRLFYVTEEMVSSVGRSYQVTNGGCFLFSFLSCSILSCFIPLDSDLHSVKCKCVV